jgi:SAM-dependent methyltransferase
MSSTVDRGIELDELLKGNWKQPVVQAPGEDRLESVACNLCGSERHSAVYEMPDRTFFRNEFFTVVECDRCGLGFLNPRPTVAEIQKYYPPEYYRDPPTASHGRYLKRRFARQASYLKELEDGRARKKLLDVGCANGDFPRFMAARGWEVEGVEISESSERITDFRLYTQEFQDIPVNEAVYDAVTAWAVFEHVHDPMAYFLKASQLVKKNGLFVFLVPNFCSVASRHLFCEDIPRHLYFFTRETVRDYLQKTGFSLVEEDNGRSVYKLAPNNWLSFMIRTRLFGKEYRFQDVPLTSKEFRRIHNLRPGLAAALKYAAYSPASVIDRMLWPAIETAQILRKTYGVSTYTARKL